MSLAPGTRLGPYEILDRIGAGGMGEVWKARDTRLGRVVAIKISKQQFSERFEREARAVAALNHSHICTLHDVGPDYLVMEYVDGEPLKGPLPLQRAVDYASQILDALDAAHKRGVIHRDLKPANILVTKQGIKLLDFGLAKHVGPLQETDATLTEALTGKGTILGTLQYMAPEQLQGKDADARSDLFSFGCVLYEMLTGKRAFEGESAASVIAAILEREPAPLTGASPLDRIVRRSLAKVPDERFQTARDLKAAMEWAMEEPPVTASQKSAHHPWIAVAALMAGALLGGLAVWRFHQRSSDGVYRLQIDPPEGGRFAVGVNIGGIALSPDGRTAAYVASGQGKIGLWVRPLDATTARLIGGTEGAKFPFWSPDSRSLAFSAKGKLFRVDLAGGPPVVICDATSMRAGTWSSEGQIVFGTPGALFQVSASGGNASALTTIDLTRGEASVRGPQMLPGNRFVYWLQSSKPENTGIYAASLSKPKEPVKLLTTDSIAVYAPSGNGKHYLLWVRGGALVAQELDLAKLQLIGEAHPLADQVTRIGSLGQVNVSASANGLLLYSAMELVSQFTWIDRTGRRLKIVGEPGQYTTFRLSPDRRRIVSTRERGGGNDIWMIDAERGVSSRFTDKEITNIFPVWSPDARTIVFTSGAQRALFRKASSGAGNEQPLHLGWGAHWATDWSRDGRFLLYFQLDSSNTQNDLWILEMDSNGEPASGAKPRPYLRTPFRESWGRFSPEASPRWVAFQSDETGQFEIYIQAFPEPRGATRISTGGGEYPQWGAGGRELFYVSPDAKLMAVSLKFEGGSITPSTPQELFPLPAAEMGFSPYDSAPDGQRFLVRAIPGQSAQPLTVIVNWPALLKKGAAAQ